MLARTLINARTLVGLVVAALVLMLVGSGSHGVAEAAVYAPDCGVTILKPDGTPWTCTFADDFDSGVLDSSKWNPQVTATSGYHSGAECFVDTPGNIGVSNGELHLTLLKLKRAFVCASPSGNYRTQLTSGMVSTYSKFTQARGRFEFRVKFPATKRVGIQSSIWMWPETLEMAKWPYSGEIDIAEWYSKYPDRVIPYVHDWYDYEDPNATSNSCIIADVAAWHTYALDWDKDALTISYDGVPCIRSTNWAAYRDSGYAPFDKPFMLALTQMQGIGVNKPNFLTQYPATTTVDYVRVWS